MLLAIQEHGGVAAAARSLAFTPPAVSQQIAALERQVGVPLLDRSQRAARLTPAGLRLAAHAERVLGDLDAAEADLASMGELASGLLRLGVIPTAARALLPLAICRLRETAPDVELQFEQSEPEDSLPALRRGELDLVLAGEYAVAPRRLPPGLDRRQLLSEPMLVAVPAGHALTGSSVSFIELEKERWIAGTPSSSCAALLERSAGLAGFDPLVVGQCGDFDLALTLVAHGQGIALIPNMVAVRYQASSDLVRFLEPDKPKTRRDIYLAIRRGTAASPGIAYALSALREAAASFAAGSSVAPASAGPRQSDAPER
ncbi:MAG TPA: LysR family transcriptional regulator [Jatrophihabitans sp.]|uniref:LysR family transcriptional regulator n=1 Tax=Jatrophihabitans sp. TaxID=1932789 RepID=UPI002EE4BB32